MNFELSSPRWAESLQFGSPGEPLVPLSPWAQFLFDLGCLIGYEDTSLTTKTVGVTLPTRSFAALLVGLGVVLQRASISKCDRQHFETLCSLPLGTPLVYKRGTKVLKAAFDGVDTVLGKTFLFVRISNSRGGNKREGLSVGQAHFVQVDHSRSIAELTLPAEQKGRHLADRSSPLLSYLVGAEIAGAFELQSRLDFLYVGSVSRFVDESYGMLLNARGYDGDSETAGTLLRSFSESKAHLTYRSRYVSSMASSSAHTFKPHVVVFDGASAFLNKRAKWPMAHRVVLLDRTGPSLYDAAASYDQEYLKRYDSWAIPFPPPIGVEVSGFEKGQTGVRCS